MFKRLGHALLIVALIAATGGHWALLQAVAWTNMLADNLRNDSFQAALTKTFDGKHPCQLCNKISEGKKSEKKTDFPLQLKKLEFVSARPVIVFYSPQDFRLLPELESSANGLAQRPPIPPPRPFLG